MIMKNLTTKNYIFTAMAILLTFSLTGCGSNPVKNVTSEIVPSSVKSKEDVKKAIVKAGYSLGWIVQEIDENTLEARITVRNKHTAKVKIPYSLKEYSILYQSSQNLNYDSEEQTIHRNYNSWINNFNQRIQHQFFLML